MICEVCRLALVERQAGRPSDHSCPAWGVIGLAEECVCPDHATWCDDCQDQHHPPVSSNN